MQLESARGGASDISGATSPGPRGEDERRECLRALADRREHVRQVVRRGLRLRIDPDDDDKGGVSLSFSLSLSLSLAELCGRGALENKECGVALHDGARARELRRRGAEECGARGLGARGACGVGTARRQIRHLARSRSPGERKRRRQTRHGNRVLCFEAEARAPSNDSIVFRSRLEYLGLVSGLRFGRWRKSEFLRSITVIGGRRSLASSAGRRARPGRRRRDSWSRARPRRPARPVCRPTRPCRGAAARAQSPRAPQAKPARARRRRRRPSPSVYSLSLSKKRFTPKTFAFSRAP